MTGRSVATSVLLDALPVKTVLGQVPPVVSGVAYDSRRVGAGEAFVAVRGLRQDARRFILDAVQRGASLIVCEGADPMTDAPDCRVLVPSARQALAFLADAFFGRPSQQLAVVGITGTNGKTTTSYLVEALFRTGGRRAGVIGTIEYRIGDQTEAAGQTTPEAVELQSLLARMVTAGVIGVAMEVSSHALALHRVDGTEFDVAVFTNLTQDHLDLHGTMEEYRRAKARLFALLASSGKPSRAAVINVDDPAGPSMVEGLPVRRLTFGMHGADVVPARYTSTAAGIEMDVVTPAGRLQIASPLVGEHNVRNLLGAVGVGLALGMTGPAIEAALGTVGAVPGRFERVEAGQPFLVVVDYAHTPDALERVLRTGRKLVIGDGRLGVVFGCGGDRDRGKRPIMGEIAARTADRVWVTSDNPRSERPEAIVADIVEGVRGVADGAEHVAIADRRTAISAALDWAREGDVVVIAGKGHETYQIIGSEVLAFDDREVARTALAEAQAREPGGSGRRGDTEV
jgi:UDP-N-acetylmuramoyl-L-alanyl-D-glutamate--2,6-diaminopimelate ligase